MPEALASSPEGPVTLASDQLLAALARGREDQPFFSHYFLGLKLHDAQAHFVTNANATINVLATANRWGKTTVMTAMHCHANVYKTGAEARFMDEKLVVDLKKFARTKYKTVHAADGWETAALVWEDALRIRNENPRIAAFIRSAPLSHPPHIDFITGSRWQFRTLGHDASGIDGNSFYLVSIDEAGWVSELEAKVNNVIRVRVADVRGRILLAGTFKPGVSKDFYKFAVRASSQTGAAIDFAHGDDDEDAPVTATLDSSIRKYLREFGIELDELEDALAG